MSDRGGKGSSSTAFLKKLWKIVNDIEDDLIKWSSDGTSFIIFDQIRFSQELLPKYYKHNNMASFIRQLNLYGFRKVASIEAGSLTADKGEIEFSHPKFIKNQPNLIEQIKRKSQGTTRAVATTEETGNIGDILREVQQLRMNQDVMNSKFNEMKNENKLIWREYSTIQEKLMKQKTVIEKLVRFLLSLVKSPGQHMGTTKWKFNHLALEGGENSASKNIGSQNMSLKYDSPGLLSITGPVIHEVTHLDGDDQATCLEKIFQDQDNTNSFAVNKSGGRSHDLNLKSEVLESIVLEDNWMESSDSRSNELDTQTVISVGNNNYDNSKIDINESDKFNSSRDLLMENITGLNTIPSSKEVITIQSPNGTFLHRDSPPLSPELLQTVNPSDINPNIVVNVTRENLPQIFTTPLSATSRPRGNSNVLKADGKYSKYSTYSQPIQFPLSRKGNALPTDKISASTNDFSDFYAWDNLGSNMGSITGASGIAVDVPQASSVLKPSKGKNWPKNGVENYGKLASNQRQRIGKKFPGENVVASSTASSFQNYLSSGNRETSNFDVAVPDIPLNRSEYINYLDEAQISLDSIKDILSTGSLNIDASAIKSLFGMEEGQLAANAEPIFNEFDISGNEMSVYNPTLYDIPAEPEDDSFNFAALIDKDEDMESVSPTKKIKLDTSFHKKDDNDDGITTPQPKQFPFFQSK